MQLPVLPTPRAQRHSRWVIPTAVALAIFVLAAATGIVMALRGH
jgi:hypothetical protein